MDSEPLNKPLATVEGELMRRRPYRVVVYDHGIYSLLILAIVIASLTVQDFATGGNVKALLVSVSIEGLVAIGMTFVVISGSWVDLSVPSTVALGSIITLTLEPQGPVVAVGGALGAALAIGLVNGIVVSRGGNPVLTTLALFTIVTGINSGLNGASAVYARPGWLARMVDGSTGPVPNLVILFVFTAVVGQFVLRQSRFGFEVYTTGANRIAARVSGVPVRRVLVAVFVVSALLAGLAGVMAGSYGGEADLNVGAGYDFFALTAVVVGGTSLFGGRGDVSKTVAGLLFIGLITNVMLLLNLSVDLQPVVLGGMIIVMVGLDAMFVRRAINL